MNVLFQKVSDYDFCLVAGKRGMKNTANWFQIIESINSIDLIEENSILFTTGVALGNELELEELIRLQSQSKACGTAVVLGHSIKSISKDIIRYCDDAGYPLFVTHQEKELSQIMHVLAHEILRSEKASLELSTALKDSISFPAKTELYVPVFKSYGFTEDSLYCMVMIEPAAKEEHLDKSTMVKLIKTVEKIQMSYGDKSFIINSEGIFLLLFSNYTTEKINYITDKILSVLNKMYGFGFYVSVGINQKHISNISDSYKFSEKINGFLKKQNIKNHIYEFDKLGLYKILMSIDNKEIMKEYIDETLGNVIAYDLRHKANLYEVLKLYLEYNGSIKATADALFLHRNSINYKIKKIEELMNCDLSSTKIRTKLYVAFLMEYIL